MSTDVTVTPWNSKPTEQNPDAHLHDCLWEMATEQAVLDRMKNTGEDFGTALKTITPQEHMKQLDILCDDNGFRKLGSNGSGRDPNLVFDDEKIKVRIDPAKLMESAPGVDTSPVGNAYTAVVKSDTGSGADVNKKLQLDEWLRTVSGFDKLPENQRVSLIEAYGGGGDRAKLAQLANSGDFRNLDEATRLRLLKLYTGGNQPQNTAKIDELVAKPGAATQGKLWIMGSEGFVVLTPEQQKRLLDRYDQDQHFASALAQIVKQDNFTGKTAAEEAHALDILYRYAGRKRNGYGARAESERTPVLIGLYNTVLATPEFKLGEHGGATKPETKGQSKMIDDFVDKGISKILPKK